MIIPADLEAGRAVGKEGAGPEEFKRPDFLIANEQGLWVSDPGTEEQDTFRLPAAVMRETAERQARFEKTAPPGMQAYFLLATTIAVDAERRRVLLLRPANYATAGVLFDVESGEMTRVLTRIEDLELKPGLRSAVLEGEHVTMLYDDRIRTYALSRASQ